MSTCGSCTFGFHDNCPMEKVPAVLRHTLYAGTPGEQYTCDCHTAGHGMTTQLDAFDHLRRTP